MRRQGILGFTVVAACALLLGHGIAAAQAQSAGTPPAPDATAGLNREVKLSPQEELGQSESFVARMDGSRTTVRQALEKARLQRDVVKTLCLNDKLNQLDVALRSARERHQSLQAAVQRSDADLAQHEFTIMSVLRQRAEQLSAEANQCIGQEASFVGESALSSTIEPGIAPDPTSFNDPNTGVIVEPPKCASCVK
jgi:hypothetical protein